MKSIKNIIAGLALAAGIAFAPVTVFAAEDTENNLPAMEVVEETAEVANEEVVFSIPAAVVEASAETTDEVVEATADTTEEVTTSVEEVVEDAASTADTTEVVAGDLEVPATTDEVEEVADASTADTTEVPVVEEVVAGDVETPAPTVEEVVEEADADSTAEETVVPVAGVNATAADAANAESTDDSASTDETVTGHQVGTANNGYAEMSDGSDAFCVEQEKDHIEEDVEYTREDDVDGSDFNNIFVARQEALDAQELSSEDVNKITQLAIWAVLSGESYEDLVEFYYHESGVALYQKMFTKYEGDWTFKYWGYVPSNDMFQKLISGSASKVVTPDEPEVPEEPETPDEPEVPDVPEQPDVPETPDTPDVPVTPDVPSEPEQPSQPEVPTTPQEPVVLSETFEAPAAPSVPVLSARMASTGDSSNTTANVLAILAALAVLVVITRKEVK